MAIGSLENEADLRAFIQSELDDSDLAIIARQLQGAQPGALLSATSAQSVTSNTTVKAALDTQVWATAGTTVDLGNDRITVNVAGKYAVWAQAGFTKDLSTRIMAVRAHIRKNSVEHQDFPAQSVHSPNGVGNPLEMSLYGIPDLAVGDTLELWVFQVNDGAAAENVVGLAADSSRTKLGCRRLGP